MGARLLLSSPEQRGRPSATLTVAASRAHKGAVLLRFEDIDDRDAAEALRGHWLEVHRDDVPDTDEDDSWWFFELIGCRVEDRRDGVIGVVRDVVEDGGGLLLQLDLESPRAGGKGTSLIPFVRAFLVRVDPEARLIETELPEGLVEACASTS